MGDRSVIVSPRKEGVPLVWWLLVGVIAGVLLYLAFPAFFMQLARWLMVTGSDLHAQVVDWWHAYNAPDAAPVVREALPVSSFSLADAVEPLGYSELFVFLGVICLAWVVGFVARALR
jgi:hypothetical protein